ncbi:MAG: hypothetical protein GY842_01685 [bacterium]|nr:hypothetical protein [bacterium]
MGEMENGKLKTEKEARAPCSPLLVPFSIFYFQLAAPRNVRTCRGGASAGHRPSFTLVELLVVLVLMSMAVGLSVAGLDGVSQCGRLSSALGQIAALDALARTQASCDGQPRWLGLVKGTGHCTLRHPELIDGQWRWSSSAPLIIGDGVTVRGLVVEGGASSRALPDGEPGVRIRADGTSETYAVVVGAGDNGAAVVINGLDGSSRYVFDVPTELGDLLALAEQE